MDECRTTTDSETTKFRYHETAKKKKKSIGRIVTFGNSLPESYGTSSRRRVRNFQSYFQILATMEKKAKRIAREVDRKMTMTMNANAIQLGVGDFYCLMARFLMGKGPTLRLKMIWEGNWTMAQIPKLRSMHCWS